MATVLVVDDSAMDRRLAGGLLEKEWRVVYASHGQEALEQMSRSLPDVVVTDLMMPIMDGLALVEAVRAQYSPVPVVLMTAKGNEEIAVQALQRGAASYVPKRNLARDLAETVQRVLVALGEERSQTRLLSRMIRSEHEFEIENDLSLVLAAVAFVQQMFRNVRFCHETDAVRIGIALEEALLNAYYHGNLEVSSELRDIDDRAFCELVKQRSVEAPYKSRRIHVRIMVGESDATFTVRDEGPGFDPGMIPDPTDPANLDRPSGRGLLLMRTFMDEVTFNDNGNEVTMVKLRDHSYVDAVA